jgi:hypothetical protein
MAQNSNEMELIFPSYDELPEEVPGYRCSWAYFNSLTSNENQKDQRGTVSDSASAIVVVVAVDTTANN